MTEALGTILPADAAVPRQPASDSELGFLWDFWYPALRSTEIVGHRLTTAMLLEVPLVLGRTSEGQAFAMRDSCPHRGIPLSYGRFDGQTLECSYHGWRFEACTGQCVEIPSLTSQDKLKVDRIFAGHYPCQERNGYVWVYMTSPGARVPDPLPAPPKLATFSEKFKITHLSCDLPSHIDHGIIGLMDPAHGPFVHSSWFWRSRGSIHTKEKKFEPIPDGTVLDASRDMPAFQAGISPGMRIVSINGRAFTPEELHRSIAATTGGQSPRSVRAAAPRVPMSGSAAVRRSPSSRGSSPRAAPGSSRRGC